MYHEQAELGDKAFSAGGGLQVELSWFRAVGISDSYIDGFKTAAESLIDRIAADKTGAPPEEMVYPVVFLYRHYLELELKQIIQLGINLKAIAPCDKLLGTHKLKPLWDKVVELYRAKEGAEPSPDLKAVGDIIGEFHTVDATGQESRYSVTTDKKTSLANLPGRLSLATLKRTMGRVYNSLHGYDMALHSEIE